MSSNYAQCSPESILAILPKNSKISLIQVTLFL